MTSTSTTTLPKDSMTPRVADHIRNLIDSSGKTRKEIASLTGFEKPNIISMLKTGDTKLPLAKIGTFARAVNTDPAQLLRLCLQDYYPEVWGAISEFVEDSLTTDEVRLVKALRAAIGVPFLSCLAIQERKKLDDLLKALAQAPTVH